MTTLVPREQLCAFCATHRVHAFAYELGVGWLIDHADEKPPDPEQLAFDRWELSQPPRFSTDYGFWKQWRMVRGQAELGI